MAVVSRDALEVANARWESLFDQAPMGIVELGPDGTILAANPSLLDLLGTRSELLVGRSWFERVHPDDRAMISERVLTRGRGQEVAGAVESRLLRDDGGEVWISSRGSVVTAEDGSRRVLIHLADVSAHRARRMAEEAAHARFSALIEHSSDVVIVLDRDFTLRYASPSYQHILGVDPNELIGTSTIARIHPDDVARLRPMLSALMTQPLGAVSTYDVRVRHADGSWRTLEVTSSNRLDDPVVAGLVCNGRDVTERVEAAERLTHLAMHDSLTGLANRALLLDRLNHAVARAERSGSSCAVFFLDLDKFKDVNDHLGHAIGDRVLVSVAERLRSVIRPGDTVARMGGDEFVIVADGIDTHAAAVEIARRITAVFEQPITVIDWDIAVTCSIGITLSGTHHPETLLQEADIALYKAKEGGRDRWEIYRQAMRTLARQRVDTEDLIRHALANDGVLVEYQPIVSIATGEVHGAEALARLIGPGPALIGPDRFVAVAEESALIVRIGDSVLDQACAQYRRWRDEGRSLGRMAVNMSARQLQANGLVESVTSTLERHGMAAEELCLEITETAIIDAGPSTRRAITRLKDLGVWFSLDDFGTGWSSLAYLRRFPIDTIKIDRSFVAGLGADHGDTEVVRAVISLAQALDLTTVAEGVERPDQASALLALGCHLAQGYLFSRPVPADRFWPDTPDLDTPDLDTPDLDTADSDTADS